MASTSLADRWQAISLTPQSEFVTLFAAYVEDEYLEKISDYAYFNITITSEIPMAPSVLWFARIPDAPDGSLLPVYLFGWRERVTNGTIDQPSVQPAALRVRQMRFFERIFDATKRAAISDTAREGTAKRGSLTQDFRTTSEQLEDKALRRAAEVALPKQAYV